MDSCLKSLSESQDNRLSASRIFQNPNCPIYRVQFKLLKAETIIHSDQGSHYTSIKFIQLLKDSELRQSMSRRANCWDNAPQESFFGHMKDEIDISGCTTYQEILAVITDWTEYYNNDRYQWDLARLSPREYYKYETTGVYPINWGSRKK